ncbi:MAG: transglutaminaseTgpA domain-containing protein [Actinomycetota bacterium]
MGPTDLDSDLTLLEERALDHLEADSHGASDLDAAVDGSEDADLDPEIAASRLALAMAFPVLGAAVMVGGVFSGVSARPLAALAGLLGMGLALVARRVRKPLLGNAMIAVGLFLIGLVLVGTSGIGNIANARSLAQEAAASGDVLRPPVELTAGWHAIVGWLMGIVGFVTCWVATVVRRQSIALLVPLPFAAIAGISVPETAQVPGGIAVLVLFAIGLGLVSSANSFEGSQRPPLSYEIRKTAKSLPVIALITVALIALAQTSFLFPDPQIDPAQEPQKPKTVPLEEVEDRVLFEVTDPSGGDPVSGPFRLGTLDVYDGTDWRLPAFSENELEDVPTNGHVDDELFGTRDTQARFRVQGLGGTVLPGLPNTVGINAQGPQLAYDSRSGNIRVASGQVKVGLTYEVAAAARFTEDELRASTGKVPREVERFLEIPAPPPAVVTLVDDAVSRFDNGFDRFNFLRNHVLDEVTASGLGTPVSITPERAQEILGDTLEATPYEIVALQAMLARWVGLPGRIGYGFDCGGTACDLNGKTLEVRPRNGAAFPEVYFPGFKWVPVIGQPKKAKPTVGTDPSLQSVDPSILPSDDIAVSFLLPKLVPPPSTLTDQIRLSLLIALGIGLIGGAGYVAAPAVRKGIIRSRRRAAARQAGPRARVALAYAEWRDHATDYGYRHPTDTPLMFLERFIDDPEHNELAWLTTRALWGDLRDECDDEVAGAAEELSRALRRRLSQAQPATLRFVATVSRLSLRSPFAPDTDLTSGRRRTGASRASRSSRASRDRVLEGAPALRSDRVLAAADAGQPDGSIGKEREHVSTSL